MSDNVSTSVRTEAQECVALPDNLLSQQLVIFFLFFRQWTGEAVMTRADLSAGIVEGNLPPEEITGSYGSLKVIDPDVLKKFSTLKKRAPVSRTKRNTRDYTGVNFQTFPTLNVWKALKKQ